MRDAYERYLADGNERDWDVVRAAVTDPVEVNGETRTPDEHVADLQGLLGRFPDYAWRLRHSVAEPPWLAVRLADHGTRAEDGVAVSTTELAMYRFEGDRVTEVWTTADDARLEARTTG